MRIGSRATRLADLGPEGADNGSFKDGWSFSGSRGFLQVLELNGHCSIGFQEFQELKVHPFQAIFGGQQSENDDDPDNSRSSLRGTQAVRFSSQGRSGAVGMRCRN